MTTPKPPKEIWLVASDVALELTRPCTMMTPPVDPDGERWHHYILAEPPKPKPREAVAYVLRLGQRRGKGKYFFEPDQDWIDDPKLATRYPSQQYANDTRCNAAAPFEDSRPVKLVRKRVTP